MTLKNNSGLHFEVLNIFLQFQLDPSKGSLVITKINVEDGQKDGPTNGQDKKNSG